MTDFDTWDTDSGGGSGAGQDNAAGGPRQVRGGLLDPSTFPTPWPPVDEPQIDRPAPQITGPLDTDVHAEVLQDIINAQAKLPPIPDGPSVDRMSSLLTGPLMTDPHAEVFQNFLNAQAGLPPVRPHPETWSINGQPYLAISAGTYDPTRSNGVTSMPTPEESGAAFRDRSRVAVHDGPDERAGYVDHSPSRVVRLQGQPRTVQTPDGQTVDTFKYWPPVGYPLIHGHIDTGDHASKGFVDNAQEAGGYGDTYSLSRFPPEPNATVSHGQVGWHVLDNGQLKFLYPPGSMNSLEIPDMQDNLNLEQKKFWGP